jgi:hypothetical protein
MGRVVNDDTLAEQVRDDDRYEAARDVAERDVLERNET